MKKTASLICTCLISLGLLAGCASNQPATGDRSTTAAAGPVKMAGPEENWANFAGAVDRDRADVVLYMLSQGISPNTIVNGGVAYENGELSGTLHGRALEFER